MWRVLVGERRRRTERLEAQQQHIVVDAAALEHDVDRGDVRVDDARVLALLVEAVRDGLQEVDQRRVARRAVGPRVRVEESVELQSHLL